MSKKETVQSTPTDIYKADTQNRASIVEWVAFSISVIWLAISVYFLLTQDIALYFDTQAKSLLSLMLIFMPVAMLWVAALAMRAAQTMRRESARLDLAIDALRQAYLTQSQGGPANLENSVSKKLDDIAAAQRKTETALAIFTSTRVQENISGRIAALPAPEGEGDDQTSLALGTPAEELAPPLSRGDFIRALNFPETAEDEDGFAALRRALKERETAQLIRAAQDVLTLLSQDGIYMDDLRPDLARPEIWRKFANGERGRAIARLGGVRDRSSLALSHGRLRQDPIFRDAAHHFLRQFDKGFSKFAAEASDSEIAELSETRTARAFMLIGRVAGTFN